MTEFNNPTAREMADYFLSLSPETKFKIEDPDTSWTITIFTIDAASREGEAWLQASYDDMHGD